MRWALGATAAAALALLLAAPSSAGAAGLEPYRGLGTWIDLYDPAAWNDPEGTAAAVAARGVGTVYLETANYRLGVDLYRPAQLGRLLDAFHEAGIRVVAWYLPSFANVPRDLRRSLAAIGFESGTGERFDGFALDIEATVVASPARRTKRLLTLSRRLRATVGKDVLGAITPSPRGMELSPTYWPGFPYAEIASLYDVFLPMSYYTYRVEGGPAVSDYTARSVAIIREQTRRPDVPIHMIGGVGDETSKAEARAFVRAIVSCDVLGYSLYDFFITKQSSWRALTSPPPPAPLAC